YAGQLRRPIPAGINLVAHYAFRGWREGKRPSPDFDPASVEREKVLNRYLVDPLLIRVEEHESGVTAIGSSYLASSAAGPSPPGASVEKSIELSSVAGE